MEETFMQIEGAAGHSLPDVNVTITSGGSIVGRGVAISAGAIEACGGNLDHILRSFGGDIEGGDVSFGGKATSVVKKSSYMGSKLSDSLDKKLVHVHELASDLESFASLAKDAVEHTTSDETKAIIKKIITHVDEAARSIRGTVDKEIKAPKQKADDFIERNGQFVRAIKSLGAHLNEQGKAGILSLSFSSVNELKRLGKEVSEALKTVNMKKTEYLGKSLVGLDAELTQKIASNHGNVSKMKEMLSAWSVLMKNHGHRSELKDMIGGGASSTSKLVDRLQESRVELKNMINKFIDAFGININGIVSSTDNIAQHLGKEITYSDDVIVFLDTFSRLSEYLERNLGSIYQHFLELNTEQVDSKEIKQRFLSSMRDLSERVSAIGSHPSAKSFSDNCRDVISTVNKFSDMIKTHRDELKKEGGSTDTMNELFSVDASKIDINGLRNPLENLKIAIKKIYFIKNIAVFRSNLQQTNKELAVYSKDYTKSVGQAIGEAITKIKNEYTDIINQISDNKAGMGLEIDMYNESKPNDKKISKEKLKIIYKWQCDARVGLYKTVEAIDLYLLHFTEAITKNPDAVADLHKMLSATKIIAKWYDQKAGDNLIRMFESFREVERPNIDIDSDGFPAIYADEAFLPADIYLKIGGDRANKIYERTRRAVEGVVVLKNIISYFISLGEKYGDLKAEKNIYMAPSNIYKNLVNYLWVSALDVNTTGTEVLTDNNETKRLLTYEDTKVKMAEVSTNDPELMGINFNKHSIDKLRIMKCHTELLRLKDFMASMDATGIQRVKQFVAGVFARLGKTDYIFEMLPFGIYDLSQMDKPMIGRFLDSILSKANAAGSVRIADGDGAFNPLTADAKRGFVDAIANANPDTRNARFKMRITADADADADVGRPFINLNTFLESSVVNNLLITGYNEVNAPETLTDGFITGLFQGLTGKINRGVPPVPVDVDAAFNSSNAHRLIAGLHYCVMNMLNEYKKNHTSSVFAIDDTYFILTIKAIAGKVMATTGVNSLFKRPDLYNSTVMQNQTRLIMGGAEGDVDIIDDAVELYVRLPLLVEFYRHIFDNANKEYKSGTVTQVLDEEQVSFVPEIGNIWSGIIINIFDKSKHIDNGIYTPDNMRKIVSEVNSIYKHYKGSVPADQLVRHVMVELVAEINRRYGVIKRQELLNYYNVVNATKTTTVDISESNYSNNDFDILNEAVEFEEKSPSDEFIKFKASIADPSTPKETKINRLTDYKILKQFRDKISNMMNITDVELRADGVAGGKLLTIVERIRMLKKAVATKTSREDKYDMIIKAIEESDSMNQASNDIFVCFHEFVITPLRTAYQMHRALDLFLVNMFTLLSVACENNIEGVQANPLFTSNIKVGTETKTVRVAIQEIATSRRTEIAFEGTNSLLVGGKEGAFVFTPATANGQIGFVAPTPTGGRAGAPDYKNENVSLLLMNTLMQFANNSGNLVKMNISTTKRITIDFSEYQKVSEYLVANVKYMVDKFTGLVPQALLEKVTSRQKGGVYWIEDKMINQVFNKLKKSDNQQSVYSLDHLNKLMPIASKVIFDTPISSDVLLKRLVLHINVSGPSSVSQAMPVIRDSFAVYNQAAKMFTLPSDGVSKELLDRAYLTNRDLEIANIRYKVTTRILNRAISTATLRNTEVNREAERRAAAANENSEADVETAMRYKNYAQLAISEARMAAEARGVRGTYISKQLFNPENDSSLDGNQPNTGIVQEFNILISQYLNHMYDAQSRKIYTKAFANFAGSALIDAINGQSFPDFSENAQQVNNNNNVPRTQVVLSSTLAYVMKTLTSRVNPVTGMKIHEVTSLQEVSPQVLEKYRTMIPMYLRIFKLFINRCRLYRKFIGHTTTASAALTAPTRALSNPNTNVKENEADNAISFANPIVSLYGATSSDVKDTVSLYIDEIVNSMSSLIQDVENVQKELLETDSTVSLYFDMKKDFTKNYFSSSKELPFAPLSVLTMGFKNFGDLPVAPGLRTSTTEGVVPLYDTGRNANHVNNKFLYGLRTLLMDEFKINSTKMPYLKSILNDFNGYTTSSNNISETKFNDVLSYVGQAMNYLYDLRFFNGRALAHSDVFSGSSIAQAASAYTFTLNGEAAATAGELAASLAEEERGILFTYQEVNPRNRAMTLVESVNIIDSRNKVAEYVKQGSVRTLARLAPTDRVPPLVNPNPRARVIMVNLVDLNIMPINVHSLMREIPLANLYNYAMTFDAIVHGIDDNSLIPSYRQILEKPYGTIQLNAGGTAITMIATEVLIADITNDSGLRFIKDILVNKMMKLSTPPPAVVPAANIARINQRLNSKIFHNLCFLTLVQKAIQVKVKSELEFINTRVVTNTNTVNNAITDARANATDVTDELFEF